MNGESEREREREKERGEHESALSIPPSLFFYNDATTVSEEELFFFFFYRLLLFPLYFVYAATLFFLLFLLSFQGTFFFPLSLLLRRRNKAGFFFSIAFFSMKSARTQMHCNVFFRVLFSLFFPPHFPSFRSIFPHQKAPFFSVLSFLVLSFFRYKGRENTVVYYTCNRPTII